MDMGAQKFVLHNSSQSAVFPTTAASFISGNTNIYFDARPVPHLAFATPSARGLP